MKVGLIDASFRRPRARRSKPWRRRFERRRRYPKGPLKRTRYEDFPRDFPLAPGGLPSGPAALRFIRSIRCISSASYAASALLRSSSVANGFLITAISAGLALSRFRSLRRSSKRVRHQVNTDTSAATKTGANLVSTGLAGWPSGKVPTLNNTIVDTAAMADVVLEFIFGRYVNGLKCSATANLGSGFPGFQIFQTVSHAGLYANGVPTVHNMEKCRKIGHFRV